MCGVGICGGDVFDFAVLQGWAAPEYMLLIMMLCPTLWAGTGVQDVWPGGGPSGSEEAPATHNSFQPSCLRTEAIGQEELLELLCRCKSWPLASGDAAAESFGFGFGPDAALQPFFELAVCFCMKQHNGFIIMGDHGGWVHRPLPAEVEACGYDCCGRATYLGTSPRYFAKLL